MWRSIRGLDWARAVPWSMGRQGSSKLWTLVRHNPLGIGGGLFVLGIAIVGALGPLVAPYSYDQVNMSVRLQGPSADHWLGTDSLGRDVLSRIIFGARVSLGISIAAVTLATFISVCIGLTSGYIGGWFDSLVQRLVDIKMSFPGLILVISLTAFFGKGVTQVIIAIAIILLGGGIRISRSAAIQTKAQAYIEAAMALGAGTPRILFRHVLPNVFAPVMITATAQLGIAILIEASASFLGYGVPPPYPSWGSMLSGEARTYMRLQPLLSLWPGLAIFLTVYSLNMLGDMLRDILDPRLRGAR